MKAFPPLAVLVLMLLSGSAAAHPGHGGGLLAGLGHPYTGLDHALAMLAVGFWAAQQKSRDALWKLPLVFMAALLMGYVLAQAGMPLPMVEAGIAASVLVLGLLVAFSLRLPGAAAGMAIAAVFALLHGYAHGVEAPVAGLTGFVAGFVLATASLHGIGLVLGWHAQQRAQIALRFGGAGLALVGAWMALG